MSPIGATAIQSSLQLYSSINKVKNWVYFKEVIRDTLKWTIILEFITNFYTFSLLFEFFLIPFIIFIGSLIAYSEAFEYKLTNSGQKVAPFLKKILSYIGILILGFVIFKTINQTKDLLTYENLMSFLLPLLFTLSFLPFIYFIALYAGYENLWIRLNFLTNHRRDLTNQMKKNILRVANLSITKLSNISDNISTQVLVHNDFSLEMIMKISKKSVII